MTLHKAVRYSLRIQTPGQVLGSGVACLLGRPLRWLWAWGGVDVSLDPTLSPLICKPLLSLQVADRADLAQLVESCKSTVVWMLEALQGLSGQELTDYLGMTG